MTLTLDQIVPWGRSFGEYRQMFGLTDGELAKRILGCGDGPASFNVELTGRGGRVTSVDPIYAFDRAEIERRVDETYKVMVEGIRQNRDSFVWDVYGDPDRLGQHRLAAMRLFFADYPAGSAAGRYVVGELPRLDFPENSFELALCSHVLFLYSEHLSYEVHLESLRELARIAAEARIFPLLGLDGKTSPHLEPALAMLTAEGYAAEIVGVNYEFQRGGNQMLRLRSPGG